MKYSIYKLVKRCLLFGMILFLLAACSNNDYLNSIPKDCEAIIHIDASQFSSTNNNIAKTLLGIDDVKKSGLDISNSIFMFETADGRLGLCAKVSSESKLKKTFTALNAKGKTSSLTERRGCNFTLIGKSWMAGFNDNALLVLGPITLTDIIETQNDIAKMLKQNEDEGITVSPLYGKLNSLKSPIAIVSEAKALPEKFIAPFTIGAPKNTDPADILLAAEVNKKGNSLFIEGETYSLNKEINSALNASQKIYRPIKGKLLSTMSKNDMLGIFMNVNGKDYLPLLLNDNALQTLLTGINTAIDMNNIIKSFNGDVAFVSPIINNNMTSVRLSAETSDCKWLADVDYWKKSVAKGGFIADWGHNAYYYRGGSTSYYFGVTNGDFYYSGGNPEDAKASIVPSKNAIDKDLISYIKDKKMVMVVNMLNISGDNIKVFTQFINPLLGKVDMIIYRMK